jgi:hypothetical protein
MGVETSNVRACKFAIVMSVGCFYKFVTKFARVIG